MTSLDYVPTLFDHIKSPMKRKTVSQLARYVCTSVCKKRHI